MGKWNCFNCGRNLENDRINAEFPFEDLTLACSKCAREKIEIIKCRWCDRVIPKPRAYAGKYCDNFCSDNWYRNLQLWEDNK